MFGFFFTEREKVTNLAEAQQSDIKRFRHFFHKMLELGVYLPPSIYEACFISRQHDNGITDEILSKIEQVFRVISKA